MTKLLVTLLIVAWYLVGLMVCRWVLLRMNRRINRQFYDLPPILWWPQDTPAMYLGALMWPGALLYEAIAGLSELVTRND